MRYPRFLRAYFVPTHEAKKAIDEMMAIGNDEMMRLAREIEFLKETIASKDELIQHLILKGK